MIDYIIIAILLLVVGFVLAYIRKQKKKGVRCMGCSSAGSCAGCSSCKSKSA